jgi:succinyl-CoA synthetase beta subunit
VARLHTEYSRPETREADVDLMEYQAKELFARHGVPVTLGHVIEDPAEAASAAEELGGRVVVRHR